MKLSQIINYPLSLLGFKFVRLAKLKKLQELSTVEVVNIEDIEQDKLFMEIFEKIKAHSMVGIERSYALYRSVKHIIANNIKGDFVECGVWKGGSSMLVAYTLLNAGISDRKIFLYDTFKGMVRPGEEDGEFEKLEWERSKVNEDLNNWALSSIEETQANMLKTNYSNENIVFIKGKVEDTIPGKTPSKIALLRLDTDWYESTKHELVHLYPLLENNGVLIIDDYGAWEGARKATDEYFSGNGTVFLNRIDHTGRLVIK